MKKGYPAAFSVMAFRLAKRGGKYVWVTTEDRVNNPCGCVGRHIIKCLRTKGVEVVRIHSDDDPFRYVTKQVNKGSLYIISEMILNKLKEAKAGQRFLDGVQNVLVCRETRILPRGRIVSFLRSLFCR